MDDPATRRQLAVGRPRGHRRRRRARRPRARAGAGGGRRLSRGRALHVRPAGRIGAGRRPRAGRRRLVRRLRRGRPLHRQRLHRGVGRLARAVAPLDPVRATDPAQVAGAPSFAAFAERCLYDDRSRLLQHRRGPLRHRRALLDLSRAHVAAVRGDGGRVDPHHRRRVDLGRAARRRRSAHRSSSSVAARVGWPSTCSTTSGRRRPRPGRPTARGCATCSATAARPCANARPTRWPTRSRAGRAEVRDDRRGRRSSGTGRSAARSWPTSCSTRWPTSACGSDDDGEVVRVHVVDDPGGSPRARGAARLGLVRRRRAGPGPCPTSWSAYLARAVPMVEQVRDTGEAPADLYWAPALPRLIANLAERPAPTRARSAWP